MSNNIRGPFIFDNGNGTAVAPGGYLGFGQTNTQSADSSGPRLYAAVGNPNGVTAAPIGSLYMESVSGNLYRNTDGATTWVLISGGGGTPAPEFLIFDSGYLAVAAATMGGAIVMPTATQHVRFEVVGRGTTAATYTRATVILNADAVAANYQSTRGLDDPAVGVLTTPIARLAASQIIGSFPAGTAGANRFGIMQGELPYNSSTHRKQLFARSGDHRAAGDEYVGTTCVEWANGAVVTDLAFGMLAGNWEIGSRLMVYAQ